MGINQTYIKPENSFGWDKIDDLQVIEEQSNNTVTFANVNGLGQSLEAGSIYEMEVIIIYNTSATTNGIKLSFNGAGAPTIYANLIDIPTSTTTASVRHYATPDSEAANTGTSRVNNNYASMKLIFGCNTTGLYYPRFASEVAGQTITIKRGSNIKIRKLQ